MSELPQTDPSPSGQQSDELRLVEPPPPPRSSLTQRVFAALEAMNGSGGDAEERYQETIRALRKQAAEAVIALTRMECEVPRRDYATRWAVVYLVGAMEDPAALPLLRQIVLTPIPPEENADPHASTVAEETIIRATAVDGVAALAQEGNEEAVLALLDFLEVPSFSIRRAAVQGLSATPKGDDIRDRIRDCLPKDQQFLADLKPVDVRKAAQVENPQRHLSDRGKADAKQSPPDVTDRSDEDRSIFQQKGQTQFRPREPEDPGDSPAGGEARRED